MPISEVYNIDNMEYMKSIPNGYFELAINLHNSYVVCILAA